MLNLVWPLSRLGGVLWGRLLPPSLPSPLPCPGRGMSDLEGLSTWVPLGSEAAPGDGETCPPAWSHSLLSPDLCLQTALYQYRLPACMHHSASASVQLSGQLWMFTWAKAAMVKAKVMMRCCTRESCLIDQTEESNIYERKITMCLLVTATDKCTHSKHQDFFASTNRIHCSSTVTWIDVSCLFLFICFETKCWQHVFDFRNAWFWFVCAYSCSGTVFVLII